MRRRLRFVRVLKWAGSVACMLILAAFVTSGWYHAHWTPSSKLNAMLARGELVFIRFKHPELWPIEVKTGADVRRYKFHLSLGTFDWSQTQDDESVVVPLWLPFLIALVPTFLLWFLDRRVPPGHCRKCRYNLTGNTTGRCPECGAAFHGAKAAG